MSVENYKAPQSAKELLQRYENGERYFASTELDEEDYDFRDVTLQGADFSESFICADFQGANLQRVNFTNANLKTCDFRNADLRGADFSGAALCATLFESANLEGAIFTDAYFYGHQLKEGERPDW